MYIIIMFNIVISSSSMKRKLRTTRPDAAPGLGAPRLDVSSSELYVMLYYKILLMYI